LNESFHVPNEVDGCDVEPEPTCQGASREVWAYLLGLYFTDGSLNREWRSCWRVSFYLAGDEGELAERVVGYLRSMRLRATVYPPRKRSYFTVRVWGSRSQPPFPEKKPFLSDDAGARNWLTGEGLNGGLGVAFVAGLLDGDGYCCARFHGKGVFGHVDEVWSFRQVKYLFLTDFLIRYLRTIAQNSVAVYLRTQGGKDILILTRGRAALLSAGVARWSFKVARFLVQRSELEKRILEAKSRFLTPSQVARMLQVHCTTVVRWCRLGHMKYIRIRGASCNVRDYRYVIPVEEVARLKHDLKRGGGG
jgi:hypothetical protein